MLLTLTEFMLNNGDGSGARLRVAQVCLQAGGVHVVLTHGSACLHYSTFLPCSVKDIQTNSVYEVQASHIYATIQLPADFPSRPPVIYIRPSMQHPVISSDGQMRVIRPDTTNEWNMQSDLGKIIHSILEQLLAGGQQQQHAGVPQQQQPQATSLWAQAPTQNPPQQTYNPHASAATSSASGTAATTTPPGIAAEVVTMADLGFPPIPDHFEALDTLSFADLQALTDDDAKFIEFYTNLQEVKQMETIEPKLQQENKLLAENNLKREPELNAAKQQLIEKHAELAEARRTYDEYIAKQDQLSQNLSYQSIKDQLDIATRESNEASDQIKESFKNGEITVDEFTKSFKAARETFHLRSNKTESYAMSQQGSR